MDTESSSEPRRRLIERIIEPAYLADLPGRRLDELRSMREECRVGESEVSFERRVTQARIDILEAELSRRRGGGEAADLIARLPEILARAADPSPGPLPERAPNFTLPRNVGSPRRRLIDLPGEKALARLPELADAEVEGLMRELIGHEKELSRRRKLLHDVMDTVQAEIVRRYVSGEVDPTAAMG